MAGMEDIVGKTGNYHVRDRFKRFDNKFIRPLILKHVQVRNIEKKMGYKSIFQLAQDSHCVTLFCLSFSFVVGVETVR